MLLAILGAITGMSGTIRDIVNKIGDLQIEKLKTSSEEKRKLIEAEVAELQARQAVLVAEAGSRLNSIMRAVAAFGPILFILTIFVWDKVIGKFAGCAGKGPYSSYCWLFVTDPLDDNLWKVVVGVLAFYFIYDVAARWRR